MRKRLSIVLPAYNEEQGIVPFCEALGAVLQELSTGYDYELIVVDGGSTDATGARVRAVAAQDPRVKLVTLSRNFGHQAALTAGLAVARGDAVVTMDCDFQDPPAVVPRLVAAWEQGFQVVYARRRSRRDRLLKRLAAACHYRIMQRLAQVELPPQVADFRLMDRVVVAHLLRLGEQARYLRGMVAWLGFRHTFVDYERPERAHGATHYPLHRMLSLAMDGMLGFSCLPLRLALGVGVLMLSGTAVLAVAMLVSSGVAGHSFSLLHWLLVGVAGMVGLQFLALWIIGEYIARIFNEVRHRPLYVVAGTVNVDPESEE